MNLAAKLLCYATPFEIANENTGRKIVFCIKAAAFHKDLKELENINDIKYVIMDQYWFGIFLLLYFSKNKLFLNHCYGVEKDVETKYKDEIQSALKFLHVFMAEVQKKYGKISSFLLPSFDQGGVYLINAYARMNDIKVISFYYEHYTIPAIKTTAQNFYNHYQAKSPGGKLLVWHQSMKDILLNANFTQEDSIIVSGAPRFHRWYDLIEKKQDSKNITLLSFPGTEYWAPFTYTDIILCLRDLSEKYANYNFIVKCKDQYHINETLSILNGSYGRLKISADLDMIDTLSQSKVVIGFNSLSFLEALLSKAYLICPYWGDSKHEPYLLQINPEEPEVQKIMEIAHSREEFKEKLIMLIGSPEFSQSLDQRIAYFNRYIYFDPNHRVIDSFAHIFKEI